mgnify:CR=1 FL=1
MASALRDTEKNIKLDLARDYDLSGYASQVKFGGKNRINFIYFFKSFRLIHQSFFRFLPFGYINYCA